MVRFNSAAIYMMPTVFVYDGITWPNAEFIKIGLNLTHVDANS